MTPHELLVKARNAIEREGFDWDHYGPLPGDEDCGSPRCLLGWLTTFTGKLGVWQEHYDSREPAYVGACEALLAVAPVAPRPEACAPHPTAAELAEDVAYQVVGKVESGEPPLKQQTARILPWLDAAIALTAPEPEDRVLEPVRLSSGPVNGIFPVSAR